jgi:hypothetical protein
VSRAAREESLPDDEPAVAGAGTSAARLARALGTEVGYDDSGNVTVEMPGAESAAPPFVPFSTAPRTVSRAEVAEAPPAPAAAQDGAAPAGAAAPGEVDVDALAETVIDKLRRELLIEREQSGGSMDLI